MTTTKTQEPRMLEMSGELAREAATTKRVLQRVPSDKLGWKPNPKSMSIGQLAMHVAMIPGSITKLAESDNFEINPANFNPPMPKNVEEIIAALEAGLETAQEYLGGLSEEDAAGSWRATVQGREIMAMPRAVMLRTLMLNHWYHHRGQLSVYLRLLEVPVPSIYGPSADENPFG